MDFSKKPEEIIEYLKRRYSKKGAVFAIDEPTFITHKRRATVFLGRDWEAGVELCRVLKNKGYTVTLRMRKLPEFEFEPIPGKGVVSFDWPKG